MNVSTTSASSTSVYPIGPLTRSPTTGISTDVDAPAITDVVSLSGSIPAASAASNTQETVSGINAGVAFVNNDAVWATVAKYFDGAAGAAAGRAAAARSIENAEQGTIAEGSGISPGKFTPLDAEVTNALDASTEANATPSTSNSPATNQGDASAYEALSASSITISTATSNDATAPASSTMSTISESDIAATDALRTLESITQRKAESPDILQSATTLLDSYA